MAIFSVCTTRLGVSGPDLFECARSIGEHRGRWRGHERRPPLGLMRLRCSVAIGVLEVAGKVRMPELGVSCFEGDVVWWWEGSPAAVCDQLFVGRFS